MSASRQATFLAVVAGLLAAMPGSGSAQALKRCNIGEQVTDGEGHTAVIVGKEGDICGLRYADGQVRGWAFWSLRPAAPAPPPAPAENTIVLRGPQIDRRLVYRADPNGHYSVAAAANGAPLRFLVDTGATLVVLTPQDARAAGIELEELKYDHTAYTGNGPVRIALVTLREIRIADLAVQRVPAAVAENGKQKQSVLGMSFLARLKNFAIGDGTLTIEW